MSSGSVLAGTTLEVTLFCWHPCLEGEDLRRVESLLYSARIQPSLSSAFLCPDKPAGVPSGNERMEQHSQRLTFSPSARILVDSISATPRLHNCCQCDLHDSLAGSSATASLTVSSVSGFSGIVNLTATVSPTIGNGPIATLDPSKVNLTSGGTANSLLSVTTSGSTLRQGYTIFVLATSGTFSHSLSISLTVQ